MAYLYRHIRSDKNEPFYIGIGSDETYNRAYSKHNRSKLWNKVVSKTSYDVEILLYDLSWEDACKKEIEFIKLYGRKDTNTGCLVNLTNGGEGTLGCIPSKETLEKRSIRLRGINNPQFGKTFSKEYRNKLSKSKLGKSRNPIVMKKLHDSLKKEVTDGINIFKSLGHAAVYYKVHQTTITRWIKRNHNNLKMI